MNERDWITIEFEKALIRAKANGDKEAEQMEKCGCSSCKTQAENLRQSWIDFGHFRTPEKGKTEKVIYRKGCNGRKS